MNNDMYFIPLIAEALEQPNRKAALQAAFEKIEALGRLPQYQNGYRQFRIFISEARDHFESMNDMAGNAAYRLAADVDELSEKEKRILVEFVNLQPEWRERYEIIRNTLDGLKPQEVGLKMVLFGEGRTIESFRPPARSSPKTIRQVNPGRYSIRLDTGRVIWEGVLGEADLIWAKAFPDQPLELAADTGGAEVTATRKIELMDGLMVLRVIPGIESGRLQIFLKDPDVAR